MITFVGSVVTPMIMPEIDSSRVSNDFVIVNTFRSKSKIRMLRAVCQLESTNFTGNTSGSIMPIIRTRKCNAVDVSGGVELFKKTPWDTQQESDQGIKFYYDPGFFGGFSSKIIISNETPPVWQTYTSRQCTGVEQFISWDAFPSSELQDIILNVGEALVFQNVAGLPTGGAYWLQVAWEEDNVDLGYTIAGNVKADGVNVSGAKVIVLTDSNRDLPNPKVEVLTTDVNGNYSKEVSSNVKASVFVQHRNGEDLFTDVGKPFVEGP